MSGRGRYRSNKNVNQHNNVVPLMANKAEASFAPDSPVLQMFKEAALKLTDRQDRNERLVKLSRDITNESKRIIFLLHSGINKETTQKTIKEAKERLDKLIKGPIITIALELENQPAYLYARAITNGLQEFIEARTLCSLMDKGVIITWPEVQKELIYTVTDVEGAERNVLTLLTRTDYILGLSDLTGELMRRTINSIASGDIQECFNCCQILRDLYAGFLGLFGAGKELAHKMSTTRNNVLKVEAAVYALRVRGDERPTSLLNLQAPPEWDRHTNHSDDEGYY